MCIRWGFRVGYGTIHATVATTLPDRQRGFQDTALNYNFERYMSSRLG
jgi:hypothetical protein